MITSQQVRTLQRVLVLIEREAQLRQAARRLELNPWRREAARDMFLKASGYRKARMALLERCGIN